MEKILTKDQILEAQDIRTEEVEVPEWGGKVLVKNMSSKERDKLEKSVILGPNKRDFDHLRAKILALSIVGEDGELLFSLDDTLVLSKKSARAVDRVFAVAQRLSGFTPKDVEELTKNSEPGTGADSPSD